MTFVRELLFDIAAALSVAVGVAGLLGGATLLLHFAGV